MVEDRCGQAEGSFAFSLSEDGSKVTSWVLWRPSYALVFEDESQARGDLTSGGVERPLCPGLQPVGQKPCLQQCSWLQS